MTDVKKKSNVFNDGFSEWLKFIWKAHITNAFWKSSAQRRYVREGVYMEMKSRYLNKYIPYIKSLKSADIPSISGNREEEKIYALWLQGESQAPPIVKACLESMRKTFGQRFVLLDENNLHEYVKLPEFVIKKWHEGSIGGAHFSDIIRVDLLYRHGGYWFDATDFVTGPVHKVVEEAPFFMYLTSPTINPHMFIQNCFIRAHRGNELLALWRELILHYWENEVTVPFYFLVQTLFKMLVTHNEEARRLFEKMPKIPMDATHRLWHEIGGLPFDRHLYDKMAEEAFFQKTSYKKMKRSLNQIEEGSLADFVINSKI